HREWAGRMEREWSRPCSTIPHSPFPASPPSTFLAFVLLLQPGVERGEVVDDRAGVHLLLAGQFLEGLLPGLFGAVAEHLPELRAGLAVAVDRALRERALVAGRLAQRALHLELQDVREE